MPNLFLNKRLQLIKASSYDRSRTAYFLHAGYRPTDNVDHIISANKVGGEVADMFAYRPVVTTVTIVSDIAIFVLKRDVKLQLTN